MPHACKYATGTLVQLDTSVIAYTSNDVRGGQVGILIGDVFYHSCSCAGASHTVLTERGIETSSGSRLQKLKRVS